MIETPEGEISCGDKLSLLAVRTRRKDLAERGALVVEGVKGDRYQAGRAHRLAGGTLRSHEVGPRPGSADFLRSVTVLFEILREAFSQFARLGIVAVSVLPQTARFEDFRRDSRHLGGDVDAEDRTKEDFRRAEKIRQTFGYFVEGKAIEARSDEW